MMPSQVWLISELYYPEDTSTGHYMTETAEGLAQYYVVNVICGQPTYSKRGTRAPDREIHNGVNIERCRATTFDKNVPLLKLVNAVSISLSIFFRAISRLRRGDVVMVVTNPPLLPFVIAVACQMRGAHCILRIDDVYPEVLISGGILKPESIAARLLNWLTNRLYLSMAYIVVLGRDMEKLIHIKLGRASAHVVVIPNWADLDVVTPQARSQNRMLQELQLESKFVVGYAGNIGPLQDVETLLASAAKVEDEKNIHFLFIGSGRREHLITRAIKEKGMTNLTFVGQIPRSDQGNFLNACDVAIVSLVPGMTGVSVPSRFYNFLGAGKPIIAVVDKDSEIGQVVQEEQVGWVASPGKPDLVANAILEAYAQPEHLAEMGKRAREVAETKYTSQCAAEAYRTLISSLNNVSND